MSEAATGRAMAARAVPAAMVLVTACMLAAGCGVPGKAGSPAAGQTSPGTTATGWPRGGSRAGAMALARRLLSDLVLPPGSRPARAQSVPPGPEIMPTVYMVEAARYIWLPLGLSAAARFVRGHPEPGTVAEGSGSGSTIGMPASVLFVSYSIKSPPAGISPATQVVMTMVRQGRGTALRARAQVVWYPPRSAAEYIRPADYRSVVVLWRNSSGHPITPVNGSAEPPAGHPLRVVLTSRHAIGELAALLNGLPAVVPGLIHGCPAFLPEFWVTFVPASNRVLPLVVTPDGCVGDLVTVGGRLQPSLADPGGSRLLTLLRQLDALRMQPVGPTPGKTARVGA